jgi:molybdenum cofactor cytidylyltransferase
MIAGLLLAAGGATRFGSQKLLARVDEGDTLVRQTALALRAETDTLVVVVGSEAEEVARELTDVDATIVMNEAWVDGLGASLRAGVRALPPAATAVLIALADQPFVDPTVMRAVVTEWRTTGSPVVSARYEGTRGHPVLFDRSMFAELADVTGDTGARSVIERDSARVSFVDVAAPMPSDVDTQADLTRLRASRSESTRRER